MNGPNDATLLVEETVISQCIQLVLRDNSLASANVERLCTAAAYEALLTIRAYPTWDVRQIFTVVRAACEGALQDPGQYDDVVPVALVQKVRSQLENPRVVRLQRRALEDGEFEYLSTLQIQQLEHCPKTLDFIEGIHRAHTIPDTSFELLQRESLRAAAEAFGEGGILEPFGSNDNVQEFYEERAKLASSEYEPPEEFYRKLVLDPTPERGDVLVLGTPDGRNGCIVRLHPKEPQAREKFAEANRRYFDRTHWLPQNRRESLEPLYDQLMEVSLIACRDRGVAHELLMHALAHADEQGYDVGGVFLEHFGCIRRVLPTLDTRVAPQIENLRSRAFFERLGAGLCAVWGKDEDFVFRKLPSGTVIGAEVTWDVRFAERPQFEHNLRGEVGRYRIQLEHWKHQRDHR
jgi:hypothetical protein